MNSQTPQLKNSATPTCIYRVPWQPLCGRPATHVLRRGSRSWYYCATHASWVKQENLGKADVVPIVAPKAGEGGLALEVP